MKTQESMENYLETIYVLNQKTGFVRSVDVALEMGFSKPSISNAMKKLKAEGYVQIEDKGRIVLTEKGKALAEGTYEKHCVISHLLMDIGVSKETALADACRMSIISNDMLVTSLHRLNALLSIIYNGDFKDYLDELERYETLNDL